MTTYADSLIEVKKDSQDMCHFQCVNEFGALLGSNDGVPAYSNCRSECILNKENKILIPSFDKSKNDVSGITWQCVEYARRWWMLKKNVRFGSVDTANQIFDLKSAESLKDSSNILIYARLNGSSIAPKVGDLLVYEKRPNDIAFQYGHVAVIVGVNLQKTYIDLAEENYNNALWEKQNSYSRRLFLQKNSGKFNVIDCLTEDHYSNKKDFSSCLNNHQPSEIKGWISLDSKNQSKN
jgi:hypothetical protein